MVAVGRACPPWMVSNVPVLKDRMVLDVKVSPSNFTLQLVAGQRSGDGGLGFVQQHSVCSPPPIRTLGRSNNQSKA